MAKNRKYRSAALRFGPALKAVLLCLLLGGSGLGYVWQKNQIYELGRQRTNLRAEIATLQSQVSSAAAGPRIAGLAARQLGLQQADADHTTYVEIAP